MANFVVLIKQKGDGCDYTIGCAQKFEIYADTTLEQVVESIIHEYFDGYDEPVNVENEVFLNNRFDSPYDDHMDDWDFFSIYEIGADRGNVLKDKIEAKNKEWADALGAQADIDTESSEKREYERLKKKYA